MEAEGASQGVPAAPTPAGQPPPPPSPLSGAYLLIIVGEPFTDVHKQHILNKIANGFLSWDKESCHVDLDKELQNIISQAPEGEEARNGERLIQFASESLVTEVLIQPQLNTLVQCVRNLLSSFTKHRHIIHAGYTFAGNGSWIVQDGTLSLADLIDAFQEPEVQRVLRAYENSVTVDIHCAPEGEWSTARLRRESFTKLCRVRVNPDDSTSPPADNIQQFVDYLNPFVRTTSIEQLLEPSDVVGNIRFSHPTLYVFPGGQGDAALFGINGFNMLVDGGFARKACYWDFVRHLDRLDAVLMTRINNSNINGLASVLRRKRLSHVYPQIGHFFCNLQERKQPLTPDEEKVRDPLLVSLLSEGQEIVDNLRHLQMKPHLCIRDNMQEPINLYHKVGHGKLDMYILSPSKDSKELREFLSKWHSNDNSLFSSVSKKPSDKDIILPLQNLVSICALLVWQPANPDDTITRILFPGSTPQQKIFEGLEKLRGLEFMKTPTCTAKTLSPSSSIVGISTKVNKKSSPAVIDKLVPGEGLSKPVPKSLSERAFSATDSVTKQNVAKTATIPVSGTNETKPKPPVQKIYKPKPEKPKSDNKTDVDKNIEVDANKDKSDLISEHLKDKDPPKIKTEKQKADNKLKKIESKVSSKINEKKIPKSSSIEKKDSVKSSPTTPKKSVEAKVNGVITKNETVKSSTKSSVKPKLSPSATPAKSAKEENNRKVVESKAKASISAKLTAKPSKKEDIVPKTKPDKKPAKKVSTTSPAKPLQKTFSPVKTSTKAVSKGKKDSKKIKGESEKGIVTDSSTVSTPSTVDAETAIAKEIKAEAEDTVVDNEIVKGSEENKAHALSKDIDDAVEEKEKVDEPSVTEDVQNDKLDDKQISEKEFSEREEEDEILIIEKVEIEQYGDDSVQDQESLESHIPDEVEDEIQKHLRDEAESEKKKNEPITADKTQFEVENENLIKQEKSLEDSDKNIDKSNVTVPHDLAINLSKEITPEKVLTPENREQIEEEVQDIITSATDFVAKTKMEQSKESSELSAEGLGSDEQKTSGEAKDIMSSPEKNNAFSDKNLTDDAKDKSREVGEMKYAEESQPDEKFSTTIESGATTAPTLPEDERIPLDEIKEGVEEKYDKEETKEKDVGEIHAKIELPTTLPQVSIVPGAAFESQTNQLLRDIVKTPDEVADLPVHEEVDGVYEEEDLSRDGSKSKEDLLNIVIGKKPNELREEDKVGSSVKTTEVSKDGSATVLQTSTDEHKKQKSDNVEKLPKDVKEEEDELNELKLIRQKLEEEDIEPKISSSIEKGTEVEEKVGVEAGKLPVKEEILEEQLIHTTLKAPEKAELVMVTPDSAPDSPLHLKEERKDISRDSIQENAITAECVKLDEKELEGNISKPYLSLTEDIHKKEDSPEKIDAASNEAPHFKPTEIIDTLTAIGSMPSTILSTAEPEDLIMNDVKKSGTPKTPPASPVIGENDKDRSNEKFSIIPESSEFLSHTLQNANAIGTKLQNVEETAEDAFTCEEVTLDQFEEEKAKLLSSEDDLKEVASTIPLKETSREKKTENENFHVIRGKEGSPKSISPIQSGKQSRRESEKDEATVASAEPASPIPSENIVGKEESVSPPSDLLTQQIESLILGHNKIEIETEKDVECIKQSPVLSKSASPLPQDKVVQSESVSKPLTPKSISPIPTDVGDVKKFETVVSVQSQDETDLSKSPVPNDEKDISKENELKDSNATLSKPGTPKSVSPIPSEKEGIEQMDQSDSVTPHEKLETPPRVSPVSHENVESITAFDKPATPKSVSPIPSEPDDIKELENSLAKSKYPKSSSPVLTASDGQITEKDVSPPPVEKLSTSKSASPIPTDENESHAPSEKPATPKSISPVPSEKNDNITIGNNESSAPLEILKSISPIQGEKSGLTETEKEGSTLSLDKLTTSRSESPVQNEKGKKEGIESVSSLPGSKPETPKSVSPVPSLDIDMKKDQKVEPFSPLHKVDTPKSVSPVPSLDMKKDEPISPLSKVDTPKSVSPVPSLDNDMKKDEPISPLSKVDTPKSVSPVPSLDNDTKKYKEDEPIPPLSKVDTPKSASPVPSLDNDMKKDEPISPLSKVDTPKSASPVPSLDIDMKKDQKTESISPLHKVDTPKSVSPVPSLDNDMKKDKKDEPISPLSKVDTPKSVSPVPSLDNDMKKDEPISPLSKVDTPKSVSPVPSLDDDTKKYKEDEPIPPLSKVDTPKSVSPVPSLDNDMKKDDPISSLGKLNTPKSGSPAPSDNMNDDEIDKDKFNKSISKPETPKSSSPVPSIKSDLMDIKMDESVLPPSKPETPKSVSPVPSDKSDTKGMIKDESVVLPNNQEPPKSTSPALSKSFDLKDIEISTTDKHPSKLEIVHSTSPILSGKKETEEVEKDGSILSLSKPETPKSTSPIPSEKDFIKATEENELNASLSKPQTPKSASPVPVNKNTVVEHDKEETDVLDSLNKPKSISPVPSPKDKTKEFERDECVTPCDKQSTPGSLSPVPDKLESRAEIETEDSVTLPSKSEMPSSASPASSEKNKVDTPKSLSPVRSESGLKSESQMNDSVFPLSEPDIPKSINPVQTEKESSEQPGQTETFISDSTTKSPKSLSPVPTEIAMERIDPTSSPGNIQTPKSGSPTPNEKDSIQECSRKDSIKTSSVLTDCEEVPKKDYFASLSNKETPKCASPVQSVSNDVKLNSSLDLTTNLEECKKGDSNFSNDSEETPKSISPISYAKEGVKKVENEDTKSLLSQAEEPKCVSPTLQKGDNKLEIRKSEELSFEQIAKSEDVLVKSSSNAETPKSISPVPSEKSDISKPHQDDPVSSVIKQELQDSPKSESPILSLKDKVSASLADCESPKKVSPISSEHEFTNTEESKLTPEEKHSIPKCSTTKNDNEEKGDVPKSCSPDCQATENILEERDLSKEEICYAEEKAEIESSEKQSQKSIDDIESCSPKMSSSEQVVNNSKESLSQESSANNGEYSQEKGILESLESEKCSKESINTDDQDNSKVQSTTSQVTLISSADKVSETSLAQSSAHETDQTAMVSDSFVGIKHDSQTGSPEKSCSDKYDTSTGSTCISQQLVMNGHSEKTSEFDTKDSETEAVIGKSLESKDIKTAEVIKSEITSKVPSTDFTSTLSLETEAKDILSSIDSGVSRLKEAVSDDLKSEFVSSSAESQESSSVHRMLVTGSSEDGGTETELCSSSVLKLTSDSSEKHLGNVAHKISPSEALEEKNLSLVEPQQTATMKKTIITTTHPSNIVQAISGSSVEEAKIKTITTIITKSCGDHPVTEVETTISNQLVDNISNLKQDTVLDETKLAKASTDLGSTVVLSQTLKKDVSDTGRSGTPASDLTSEKEFEIGGPGTPHSDISSGQVSRAATNVWGESSEGRPDSRHYESDDDIPCSPMSATSHIAQSPPQFDFDIHQHSKDAPSAMTSSLYGGLPEEDPLDEYLRSKNQTSSESQMYSSMYVSKYDDDDEEPMKPYEEEGKGQFEAMFSSKKEDIDFETAVKEHVLTRGEDLTAKFSSGIKEKVSSGKIELDSKAPVGEQSTNGNLNGKSSQPDSLEYQESLASTTTNISLKSVPSQLPEPPLPARSTSETKDNKDPIESWGKPLGLPPPPKNLIDSPLSRSTLTLVWNPADEWGIPLGLPSPAPPPVKKDSMNGEIDVEITSTSNKTTPKKVAMRNAENKSASNTTVGKEANYKSKHPESPVKRASNKDGRSKSVAPVYMDLTYVPHHGNSHYTTVEFFKRVRARYYVFSGTEPSREVFNALLEAKQTWEDKDLEVTIIPTYDTDTLGYWVAENEDILAKYKIDLSPSASRCTINLQDHETSCSAYRLEF